MNLRQTFWVSVLAPVFVCSCAKHTDPLPTANVSIDADEQNPNLVDRYHEIDKRALLEVKREDAGRALRGDREMALAIAFEFAEANQVTEARFWFQIASENGSAIAMTHLSVMLQDSDCRRANYWLKKALATGEFGEPTESSMKASLASYEAGCKR